MRVLILAPVAAACLALGACSDKTGDHASATVNSAMNDTAANFNAVGTSLDNAGEKTGAAIDNAASATGNAADNAGDAIGNAASNAATATGNALEKSGRALKNEAK